MWNNQRCCSIWLLGREKRINEEDTNLCDNE
ncbi:hypothetical protein TNIN_315271, partial [Trichonephila inaurata madagascariensis]